VTGEIATLGRLFVLFRPTSFLTIIIIYLIIQNMRINKRELLKKLTYENLWKRLSSEEIRLYLLLIIFADKAKGTGRLSSKVLEGCLGSNFLRERLEKAAHDLEKLRLVKLDISSPRLEIEFEFLRGKQVGIEKQRNSSIGGDSQSR